MKYQLQGIGILLLSILLLLSFQSMGIRYVGDLDLEWPTVFLLLGLVGFAWMFRKPSVDKGPHA